MGTNPHFESCPICHRPIGERYRVAGVRRDHQGIPECVYVHPDCLPQVGTVQVPGVRWIEQLKRGN